jgi:hypothetical protein
VVAAQFIVMMGQAINELTAAEKVRQKAMGAALLCGGCEVERRQELCGMQYRGQTNGMR